MTIVRRSAWAVAALAATCDLSDAATGLVLCWSVSTCKQAYDRCVDVRTRNNIPKDSLTCEASLNACYANGGVWRGTSMGAGTRMIECKVSVR